MSRGFYHPTQNATQLETNELFISGTFHVILLDPSSLQVKLQKAKPQIRGGPLTRKLRQLFSGGAGERTQAVRLVTPVLSLAGGGVGKGAFSYKE